MNAMDKPRDLDCDDEKFPSPLFPAKRISTSEATWGKKLNWLFLVWRKKKKNHQEWAVVINSPTSADVENLQKKTFKYGLI